MEFNNVAILITENCNTWALLVESHYYMRIF